MWYIARQTKKMRYSVVFAWSNTRWWPFEKIIFKNLDFPLSNEKELNDFLWELSKNWVKEKDLVSSLNEKYNEKYFRSAKWQKETFSDETDFDEDEDEEEEIICVHCKKKVHELDEQITDENEWWTFHKECYKEFLEVDEEEYLEDLRITHKQWASYKASENHEDIATLDEDLKVEVATELIEEWVMIYALEFNDSWKDVEFYVTVKTTFSDKTAEDSEILKIEWLWKEFDKTKVEKQVLEFLDSGEESNYFEDNDKIAEFIKNFWDEVQMWIDETERIKNLFYKVDEVVWRTKKKIQVDTDDWYPDFSMLVSKFELEEEFRKEWLNFEFTTLSEWKSYKWNQLVWYSVSDLISQRSSIQFHLKTVFYSPWSLDTAWNILYTVKL